MATEVELPIECAVRGSRRVKVEAAEFGYLPVGDSMMDSR